ncbi:MFS transporter [Mycobacterium sp. 141]|uniref:MFS transporter n=1 Tax=Mycobacterium sp. 141 TaxID=1120797 RepID=UPI000564C295|nr:MFS transporter [Mycobacterium sp. 141]
MSLATANVQRVLIALCQVAALSCWFSASAVAPSLSADLDITGIASVALTSSVQLGFVLGAIASAVLNIADRFPAHQVFCVSATFAAGCTFVLPLCASTFSVVALLRLCTGVALAGVYPIGVKLIASWATPATRALALGILVGALTLGSALPQLIRGIGPQSWQSVMFSAAAVTLVGGLVTGKCVTAGPHLQAARPVSDPGYALRMFTERRPRLAVLGYLGHMWELYALWTWMPAFILASQQARDGSTGSVVHLTAFAAIGAAGVLGCLIGGYAADRFGRSPAAVSAMVLSALCCILSPLLFAKALSLLAAFLFVWGAAVIADSGVFSTALSETANPRLVGTALTAQTAFGFLLTIITIHLVPVLADHIGWRWALTVLAIGPSLGALAMSRYADRAR